jgi:hypothetical protein
VLLCALSGRVLEPGPCLPSQLPVPDAATGRIGGCQLHCRRALRKLSRGAWCAVPYKCMMPVCMMCCVVLCCVVGRMGRVRSMITCPPPPLPPAYVFFHLPSCPCKGRWPRCPAVTLAPPSLPRPALPTPPPVPGRQEGRPQGRGPDWPPRLAQAVAWGQVPWVPHLVRTVHLFLGRQGSTRC